MERLDVALRNVWLLALKLTILGREFGEVKEKQIDDNLKNNSHDPQTKCLKKRKAGRKVVWDGLRGRLRKRCTTKSISKV